MKATVTPSTADRPTRRKQATSAVEPATNAPATATRSRKSAIRFFYDEKGRKSHVLLDIKLYEQLLDDLEMVEDVRA